MFSERIHGHAWASSERIQGHVWVRLRAYTWTHLSPPLSVYMDTSGPAGQWTRLGPPPSVYMDTPGPASERIHGNAWARLRAYTWTRLGPPPSVYMDTPPPASSGNNFLTGIQEKKYIQILNVYVKRHHISKRKIW